jgi:TolB-like protein
LSLFNELKRRNVFKVGIAYVVVAWLVAQVLQLVFESFGTPDWVMKTVLVLLATGLPFALFFAWAFEMTPDGLKRESEVDRSQSITHETGQKLNYTIISVLVLSLGYFAYDKFVLSPGRESVAIESALKSAAQETSSKTADALSDGERASPEPDKSIAVMPFADMSPNKDQEYFSDGLSEELLNLLAKIPELRVAARTSSFSFKGQNLEIPEIAQRLKVAHVLEGSVRTSGNQIRVTAQLIKADDGYHIWSQTFDRNLDNVFAIQDEIAAEVVRQLKVTLLGAVPTANKIDPQAYALFLRGRQLSRQFTEDSLEQANVLYEQALAIDPDYALAWAELSRNYINMTNTSMPLEEGMKLAQKATRRALAIDPNLAVAIAQQGWQAASFDGDVETGARHFERAMSLDSSNLDILRNASQIALFLDRVDVAISLGEYITRRDPLGTAGYESLGIAYLAAGRLDDALETTKVMLSLSPGRLGGYYRMGQALLLKNLPEEALAAFIMEEADEEYRLKGITLASYSLGRELEYHATFAELEEKFGEKWPSEIAHVYAWTGDADSAFAWLEKELLLGSLTGINTEPLLAGLHDDPRWQPLLEKAGVSAAQLAAVEFNVTLPE